MGEVKKPCAHQPCRNLVESGRCPEHQRPTPSRRGYGRRWQSWRARYIAEVVALDPFCSDCRKPYDSECDIQLHHIRKLSEQPELQYDRANIRHLCEPCHSARTAKGE